MLPALAGADTTVVAPTSGLVGAAVATFAAVGVLDPRALEGGVLEPFGAAAPLHAERSAMPAVVPASFNTERRLMEWLVVVRLPTAHDEMLTIEAVER